MATIDFPTSPVDGQQFLASNGVTYVWHAVPGAWLVAGSLDGSTGSGAVVLQHSPVLTGDPTAPQPPAGDSDTSIATTGWVQSEIASVADIYAPIASPLFTGNPRAPTPADGDDSPSVATTEWVQTLVGDISPVGVTVEASATGFLTTPVSITGIGYCATIIVDANDKPTFALDTSGRMWLLDTGFLAQIEPPSTGVGVSTLNTSSITLPGPGGCAVVFTGGDDKPVAAIALDGSLWELDSGVLARVGGGPAGADSYGGGTAYTSIYGSSADRAPHAYLDPNVILMFIVRGQSLAMGSNPDAGSPVDTARSITSTYPDNVLMFGLEGQPGGICAPAGQAVDRFVPCIEQDGPGAGEGGSVKETICTSFGNKLFELFQAHTSVSPQILMTISATGGTPYRGMKRGTPTSTETRRLVQRAVEIAAAQGKRVVVGAIIVLHGEADNSDGREAPEYSRYLTQWRAQDDADIRAITGQYEPVRMLVSQCNRRSDNNKQTSRTPLGAYMAMAADPLITCTGPIYDVDADSTSTHPYSWGYLKMGVRSAFAMFDEVFDVGYQPLHAVEAYWQTTTTFRIRYNRPVTVDDSGTIIDTTLDISATRGFIFQDGTTSGTPTVTNATSIATDLIELTLSAAPTGLNPRFLYATYSSVGQMGRVTGPRGCIRATPSWGTARDDRAVGGTVPVYDWAVTETIYPGLGVAG